MAHTHRLPYIVESYEWHISKHKVLWLQGSSMDFSVRQCSFKLWFHHQIIITTLRNLLYFFGSLLYYVYDEVIYLSIISVYLSDICEYYLSQHMWTIQNGYWCMVSTFITPSRCSKDQMYLCGFISVPFCPIYQTINHLRSETLLYSLSYPCWFNRIWIIIIKWINT